MSLALNNTSSAGDLFLMYINPSRLHHNFPAEYDGPQKKKKKNVCYHWPKLYCQATDTQTAMKEIELRDREWVSRHAV